MRGTNFVEHEPHDDGIDSGMQQEAEFEAKLVKWFESRGKKQFQVCDRLETSHSAPLKLPFRTVVGNFDGRDV